MAKRLFGGSKTFCTLPKIGQVCVGFFMNDFVSSYFNESPLPVNWCYSLYIINTHDENIIEDFGKRFNLTLGITDCYIKPLRGKCFVQPQFWFNQTDIDGVRSIPYKLSKSLQLFFFTEASVHFLYPKFGMLVYK